MNEERQCNECGETWPDPGYPECPFCNSENTRILEDDDDEKENT